MPIVGGAQNLLKDVLTWILILLPIAAAAMIGFHSLMKILSDGDPNVIADRNKKISNVLKAGVIGECAMAIVTFIFSYFK